MIRISYGADRRSFGCSKAALYGPIAQLPEIRERLKNVLIECKDFEKLIADYDSPGTIFYLDPPYYGAERFYDTAFPESDHYRLKQCLNGIKGQFILSYNNHPKIIEIYDGYYIIPVSRKSNLNGRYPETSQIYEELIIKNF